MLKTVLLSLLFVLNSAAAAASLEGHWRLSDKPVWMTIESGVGLVAYSKDDPDARGKILLRNLSALDVDNRWRQDRQTDTLSNDEALANAPSQSEGCFLVPPVLGAVDSKKS